MYCLVSQGPWYTDSQTTQKEIILINQAYPNTRDRKEKEHSVMQHTDRPNHGNSFKVQMAYRVRNPR